MLLKSIKLGTIKLQHKFKDLIFTMPKEPLKYFISKNWKENKGCLSLISKMRISE